MNTFLEWIGEGKDLSMFQMGIRTILIFIFALVAIRFSGRRSFGMRSPFDNVVSILLGAILSRVITGASPFFPTIGSALLLAMLHRAFAWVSLKSDAFGRLVKGDQVLIYKEGEFIRRNMNKCLITFKDLEEGLREELNNDQMDNVDRIYVERSGKISVVKK
ncbi:MAG: DUF421 domain-containing protein [Bacteroidia bacterium]